MNRLAILTLAVLVSCATDHQQAAPSLPGQEKPRTTSSASTEEPGVGYFPLPPALSADPTKLKIPPLDFKVRKPERIALSNGMTLYLVADHSTPLVELRALIAAGTVDDPPEKVGLAELMFGLLASSGTRSLSADQLDELLEFYAADSGGGSAEEYSSVEISLRSQDLQRLFSALIEILRYPRFQKDRFEIAVARTIESIQRRPDSPDGLAMRALRKAIFGPDSLFGRESSEKTIKSISLADIHNFHQRAVVPKAISLMITGDFERESTLALIRQHAETWVGGEKIARQYPPPTKLSRRVVFVPKEIAQSKIRIGEHGFFRLAPEEYAIRVMSNALGGSLGAGRLFREVRGAKGLAYSAYSVAAPGPTGGYFFAAADTKPPSTSEATDAILKILHDITGPRPLSAAEISVASDQYLNSFVFRFDSAEKIAFEKAVFDFFGYPENYLDTFRDKIAHVTPSDVLAAAKMLVKLDQMQIVIVGPANQVGDLSRFGPVVTIHDVQAFR